MPSAQVNVMTQDDHDEYYARQQAHRAELWNWFGKPQFLSRSLVVKIVIFAVVVLLIVGSAAGDAAEAPATWSAA